MNGPGTDLDYLALSAAERLVLVQDILDSVMAEAQAEPLSPEDIAEMDRRCLEIDSGAVKSVPWAEVRDQFLAGQ
jgi:putative addiction module component (TIGR02574 family)